MKRDEIEEFRSFKTPDGKIHHSYSEACEHIDTVNFASKLDEIIGQVELPTYEVKVITDFINRFKPELSRLFGAFADE